VITVSIAKCKTCFRTIALNSGRFVFIDSRTSGFSQPAVSTPGAARRQAPPHAYENGGVSPAVRIRHADESAYQFTTVENMMP
jgi:hypothetical protein